MKERTLRRLITVCLCGSLGLTGCHLITPKPPHPLLAPRPVAGRKWTPLPEKTLNMGTTVTVAKPNEGGKAWGSALPSPSSQRTPSPPPPPSPLPGPSLEEAQEVTPLTDPVEVPPKEKSDRPDAPPKPASLPEPATLPESIPESLTLPEPAPEQDTSPETADPAEPATSDATHAADYSWLCGELQEVTTAHGRGWRLRYADLDKEDTYGGSVLLVAEPHRLSGLEEGQRVRVAGRLIDPEMRTAGARYHVETLTVVSE